jgi:hypothetical protein
MTNTFEHELARSPVLLPFMLKAFESLRPLLGRTLRVEIGTLATDDAKADAFLARFLECKVSKGRFAQELADLLESANLHPSAVPQYILAAFSFLGVVKD